MQRLGRFGAKHVCYLEYYTQTVLIGGVSKKLYQSLQQNQNRQRQCNNLSLQDWDPIKEIKDKIVTLNTHIKAL